jgi:hypothetical protein
MDNLSKAIMKYEKYSGNIINVYILFNLMQFYFFLM